MAKIEIIFPSANIIPGNINHNDLSGLEGLGPEYIHLNQEEYNNLTIKPDLQSVLEEGSTASIETNFSIRTFDDYDYGTKFRLLGDGDTFSKVDLGLNTSNGNVSLNVDSSGITDSISLNHNNADGDKSITIDEISMKIIDTNKELGLIYDEDYTTNQLSNDRAITDVGGVKALINQGTSSLVTGVKGDAEATYRIGQVNITANNIGLGNVNNTSDLNKPISNATQLALDNTVKKTGETFQSIVGNVTILGNIQSGGNITSSSNIIAAGNISTSINPTLDDHTTRKGYVDSKIVQTITSGVTASAPSQNAVYNALQLKADITYVDGLVSTAIRDAGNWDASSNTFPTTGTGTGGSIRRGDLYRVSVAGNPFGTEESLDVGDSFRALIANPGQTTSNWAKLEANTAQATESFRGTSFLLTSTGTRIDGAMTQLATTTSLNSKQDTLVSGTNIKTVGGQSLVGAGNVTEVQNSLTSSTILAPSVDVVNTALGLKANDNAVVHLAGSETITGTKTFTNTSASTAALFASSSATSNAAAISFGNTTQNAIRSASFSGTNFIEAILTSNNAVGVNFNTNSSYVGDYLNFKLNGALKYKVDYLGNVTGNSFFKTGGTASQFLKADGTTDATSYQPVLVSGTNIKTVGGNSVLGSGDIPFPTPASQVQNSLTPNTTTLAPSVTAVNAGLALKADDNTVIKTTTNQTKTGNFNVNGMLSVNETSPLAQLQANGTSTTLFTAYIRNSNTAPGTSRALLVEGGTNSADYSAMFRNSAGTEYFTIRGDGQLISKNDGTTSESLVRKSQLDTVANATKTGSSTQSGNGTSTSFNIPHGLGTTPTYWNAVAISQAAGNISYITANSTNIIVNYAVAPATGTNNLAWNWIAR